MDITKVPSAQSLSPFKVIGVLLNTINHVFIGTITIYFTYFCTNRWLGPSPNTAMTQHIFLSTIGYQLLMAEGMLTFYTSNTWTNIFSKPTKTGLHIALQVAGSGLAIAGFVVIFQARATHFSSIHGITGFISFIFLLITFVNGFLALFAKELGRIVKPVFNKLFHNFFALATFVVGMVSLIYGYKTGTMSRNVASNVILGLTIGTSITLVLSSIGSLLTMYEQLKGILRR